VNKPFPSLIAFISVRVLINDALQVLVHSVNTLMRTSIVKRLRGIPKFGCVIAALLMLPSIAFAGGVISNGVVKLGIDDAGNLVVADPTAVGTNTPGITGLTYLPSEGEALGPGCACEGWGVADAITSRYGKAGATFGNANIIVESFTATATTAKSVVRVNDGSDLFRVTHEFSPSASANLFQVKVTIENISGAATHVRYRRVMDWDVPPTEFDELTTVQSGSSSKVVFTSDDGFADGNPLAGPSEILFSGNATDSGPADHGALFDFDFGTLNAGASLSFVIFYGAAADQQEAESALAAVNAEAYSLGKPDPAGVPAGTPDGGPNTFIFAFAGIGGSPIFPTNANTAAVPVPVGGGLWMPLLALSLAGLGALGWRRCAAARV